jgi:hypothetical protein
VETNLQNNNSIQFNGRFLMCRLNSTSAYYKASKKTRNTKSPNTHKEIALNKAYKNNMTEKSNIKEVLGQKH